MLTRIFKKIERGDELKLEQEEARLQFAQIEIENDASMIRVMGKAYKTT